MIHSEGEPQSKRSSIELAREEQSDGSTLIYRQVGPIVRIYRLTTASDGTSNEEYLPYQTLDYALEENRKNFPPLDEKTLNVLISNTRKRN